MMFRPDYTIVTTLTLPCLCGQGTIIAPLVCPAHGPQPAPQPRCWFSTSANLSNPPPRWA